MLEGNTMPAVRHRSRPATHDDDQKPRPEDNAAFVVLARLDLLTRDAGGRLLPQAADRAEGRKRFAAVREILDVATRQEA